jgi:hypothetical protein
MVLYIINLKKNSTKSSLFHQDYPFDHHIMVDQKYCSIKGSFTIIDILSIGMLYIFFFTTKYTKNILDTTIIIVRCLIYRAWITSILISQNTPPGFRHSSFHPCCNGFGALNFFIIKRHPMFSKSFI